jgi:hypothetical protein
MNCDPKSHSSPARGYEHARWTPAVRSEDRDVIACIRATGRKLRREIPICGVFGEGVWATGWGHGAHCGVWSDNKMPYFQAFQEAGATGLEPATSGVTGRVDHRNVDDVRCGIALSMPSRRRSQVASERLSGDDVRRLLPVCCPRRSLELRSNGFGGSTPTSPATRGRYLRPPSTRDSEPHVPRRGWQFVLHRSRHREHVAGVDRLGVGQHAGSVLSRADAWRTHLRLDI